MLQLHKTTGVCFMLFFNWEGISILATTHAAGLRMQFASTANKQLSGILFGDSMVPIFEFDDILLLGSSFYIRGILSY